VWKLQSCDAGEGAAVATLIVLFNLRSDASRDDYERWAAEVDVPTVTGLGSVDSFSVHRVAGLLGADAAAPYQYVEVIEVNDLDGLMQDVSSETMAAVSAQFQTFAQDPIFMLADRFLGP
jgi:REDY-like protein HapK